jgi:hypothetical protein
MSLLSRVLATFSLGLVVTGVVIGLLPGGDCGSAFSSGGSPFDDPDGCSTSRAERRAMPVALIGLGATAGLAAIVVFEAATKRED